MTNDKRQTTMPLGRLVGRAWLVSLALFWRLTVAYETAAPSYRVCVLKSREAETYQQAFQGLMEELKARGYREGVNLEVSPFVLEGKGRDSEAVRVMMRRQPDLIVAIGTNAAILLRETFTESSANKAVPVVFTMVLDPVALGLVHSMERGGTSFAGVSLTVPPTKQFRLLKDLVPQAKRVGVVYNRADATSQRLLESATIEAARVDLQIYSIPVRQTSEVSAALERSKGQMDALWLIPDICSAGAEAFKAIMAFAEANHVPVIGFASTFVRGGALAAVGVDFSEQGALAAEIAVKILEGMSPEDMPVQAPRQFRLSLNLKTARALQIPVPGPLLNLADEVYE